MSDGQADGRCRGDVCDNHFWLLGGVPLKRERVSADARLLSIVNFFLPVGRLSDWKIFSTSRVVRLKFDLTVR